MITNITTKKLMLFAGAILLAAVAFLFPLDAFAQGVSQHSSDVADTASKLSKQMGNFPKLIATASYVIGTFFAVRSLFALKGFIEAPDDNPVTKVLAFGAVSAMLIMLPYIMGVLAKSMDAKNVAVTSSSQSFATDTGF